MLVLTGGGDPGLTTADLSRLVRVALGRGLTKVSRIIVDQRRFSGDFTPPAFEQQPSEWAPFRANISALALDGNSVSLNVLPGAGGEAARVWYEPPGVVSQAGEITSGKAGSGDRVSWRLDVSTDPRRPLSKVSGTLASELDRRRYSRRLEDPRLAGGYALGALLREQGVRVGDEVVLADSASDAGLLGDIDRRKSITWIASSPLHAETTW